MYMPEKFLTVDVLAEEVAKFQWPAAYKLVDYHPDGIAMVFPKCTLFFEEGFESHMELMFLAKDTGLDNVVKLTEVLVSMGGVRGTPNLIDEGVGGASLETVQIGIHNICTIILAHFPRTPLGDFSWVEKYKAYRASKK
jgi:hypothetical protein